MGPPRRDIAALRAQGQGTRPGQRVPREPEGPGPGQWAGLTLRGPGAPTAALSAAPAMSTAPRCAQI